MALTDIQRNFVPRRHKVLVLAPISVPHMVAVRQGQVLPRQLTRQGPGAPGAPSRCLRRAADRWRAFAER